MAGLAALVRQRFPDYSPAQVASYLKDQAAQRESPDPNNTWGHGFAQLPDPGQAPPPPPPTPTPAPSDPCVTDLGELAVARFNAGSWTGDCDSLNRSGSNARYYSFSLPQQNEVHISLTSDQDTYLFLLEGEGRDGTVLSENDDVEVGNTSSALTTTLAPGSYTVEATTYSAGATGDFTLTVTPAGAAPPPTPGPADPCLGLLTADGTVSGQWAQGCDSEAREGRHARWYGFLLTAAATVTATLESTDADTYLFLRKGDARSGDFLKENDDHENSTEVSQVQADLVAGAYTIEATTYGEGETGSFTLTVSGIGAAAPAEACVVGMVLTGSQGCSGDEFSAAVESSGDLVLRFTGTTAPPDGLALSRGGGGWRVNGLP